VLLAIVNPGDVLARGNGEKMVLAPEAIPSRNSQTMELLQGYLNSNPTGALAPDLAIVDNTALEPMVGDANVFVDLGHSGAGQISVYTVRKGDTLAEIANMFGVSSNTIIWANDIKGGRLREGQELVILPISGVRHTVQRGDTLQTIARKYKAELSDVLSYNNLSPNTKITPGDIIIVPDGEISAVQTVVTRSTTNPAIVSAPSGYYIRPIVGGRKSQGLHGYNAVDLAAPTGTPVMASADGEVIVSRTGGYNGGYGTYIVVRHPNGTQTLYGHLSRNYVSVGQRVSQGQVIGAVGNTGRSTGPHLHFEVRGARNPF